MGGCRVDEGFLPIVLGVVESNNGEPELVGPRNGFVNIWHLECQVMHSLPVLVEVPVEKVVFVIDKRADHLEAALPGEIELDPSKVSFVAEAATDMGSTEKINECLGDVDVVDRDRDMVEPLDDVPKALMHRLDVGHGVAILRSYHCKSRDSETVRVRYMAARIMNPAKN